MRSMILALAFCSTAVAVEPAADAASARALAALRSMAPQAPIDGLRPAPISGFYEASLGGQPVLVSADGRYLVAGAVWDVPQRRNLSDANLSRIRRDVLAELPAERRIVFAAREPKRSVTVLTALDCGYCRKLHEQIQAINGMGISVEYLLIPRGGLQSPSFDAAVSVWCAPDRAQALTDAKRGSEPRAKTCSNPVTEHTAIAQRLGLNTTPTLIAADGAILGGYLTPQQLAQALDAAGAGTR